MMVQDKENDSDVVLTLECVRGFLLKHDGKIKQCDLANHFRSVLTTTAARDQFKNILQLISAIKTDNGRVIFLPRAGCDKTKNLIIILVIYSNFRFLVQKN